MGIAGLRSDQKLKPSDGIDETPVKSPIDDPEGAIGVEEVKVDIEEEPKEEPQVAP